MDQSQLTCAEAEPGLAGMGFKGVAEVVPEALASDAVVEALTGTPNRVALSIALSCSLNGTPKRAALFLRFSSSAFSASGLLTVP